VDTARSDGHGFTDGQATGGTASAKHQRVAAELHLPSISASQVTLLSGSTDGPTCRRARDAYAKLYASDTIATPSVDVVKVGSTNFVVSDRKTHVGEFSVNAVMDTSFKTVGLTTD
jgi:hypothetical protein